MGHEGAKGDNGIYSDIRTSPLSALFTGRSGMHQEQVECNPADDHGRTQKLSHGKTEEDETQLFIGLAEKFHRKAEQAVTQ